MEQATYTIGKDGAFYLSLVGSEFEISHQDEWKNTTTGEDGTVEYRLNYEKNIVSFLLRKEVQDRTTLHGYSLRGEWVEDPRMTVTNKNDKLVLVKRYDLPLQEKDQARYFGGIEVVYVLFGRGGKILFSKDLKTPVAVWSAKERWGKAKSDLVFGQGLLHDAEVINRPPSDEYMRKMMELQGLVLSS